MRLYIEGRSGSHAIAYVDGTFYCRIPEHLFAVGTVVTVCGQFITALEARTRISTTAEKTCGNCARTVALRAVA